MTIAAFEGICPTCGHDHDAENAEFQRMLRSSEPATEAVRDQALEEAATVCVAQKNPPRPHHQPGYVHFDPANVMADKCAAAIRALKGKGASQGPDFNAEVNLHADTVAERFDASDEQKG